MSAKLVITAIEEHDVDQLATMLAEGADPNRGLEEHPESLPLHAAVEEMTEGGTLEAVKLLLQHGAHPDGDPQGRSATPLLLAVMHGLNDATEALLGAGADPNFVSDEGASPLRLAVEQKDIETAKTLLRFGATKSINDSGGPSGMNALGRAAYDLNIPMIELLLAAQADPTALDLDHQTARDRLPPRETNPEAWEKANKLLG